MNKEMFCFQCEQTAGCRGCTGKSGVCGKSAATANLQDQLTGALIRLAKACSCKPHSEGTEFLMVEALFATLTNVNFNDEVLRQLIDQVNAEKNKLLYDSCPADCQVKEIYDMNRIWNADEDIRSLKSLILFGIRGVAAYAYHGLVLGYRSQEVQDFLCKALCALAEDLTMEELLPIVLEVGKVNLTCMELLDKANTETYGHPTPTQVTTKVEKGPFIVITGHDLHDLKLLLEQTKDMGINIYTHGEMLPAHAYPELKKYAHLKGNYGTAWQNQQKEFANLPAPILFTTNCIMPVKDSYADRVFTTGAVSYPGMTAINRAFRPNTGGSGNDSHPNASGCGCDSQANAFGSGKDFRPVIEKALALGGFPQDMEFPGVNGGDTLTTGFGHNTILSVADQVIQAVKDGAIRHFFLVGGCDGARMGRNYYTDFVKQTPGDTIVLTLACGKYRFNDLDLGTIGGLPRLMDMGQCNDAYGAIKVACALAEAFGCGVNELPLSMVLSWYEQKAVCILLTLLHLGIKNIKLGPTLPAFLSPNVLNFLVEQYHIAPITAPQEDMKELLGE